MRPVIAWSASKCARSQKTNTVERKRIARKMRSRTQVYSRRPLVASAEEGAIIRGGIICYARGSTGPANS